TFSFSAVENLTGGSGVDTFKFKKGKSISGAITGGGAPVDSGDWLDYSAFTTAVTVNLATGSATGAGGGVTGIQNVTGGAGNDNPSKLIWGKTVLDDGFADTLTGGAGLDWFFANRGPGGVLDTITDLDSERVN